MDMEFKVKEDNYNSLLKRKEIRIEVDHEGTGTPSRVELKKAVAAKYGTKLENVYVIDVETKTGTQSATCELQVYDDLRLATSVVPKYIQVRDLPSEQRKQAKEQKAKKKEEKPKEEKPKEEKAKSEKGKEEKPKQEEKKEEKTAPETTKKGKESTPK
jgi:ribosomal protein S24E